MRDPKSAFEVMAELVRSRDRAARLRARPAKALPDGERIEALLALAHDDDAVLREKAVDALAAAGELALPALRRSLDAGGWKPPGRLALEILIDDVRPLPGHRARLEAGAVEALERVGTPAARRLLKDLAAGASDAPLTKDAKAALSRLEAP